MGYFAHLMKLNELQINGETVDDKDDFNVGEEDTGADANADAPDEVAADAAEDTEDNIRTNDDNAETQDVAATADDEEDNFTIADDDENLDNAEGDTAETNDNEAPAEDTGDANADPAPAEDDGQEDDFTVDGGGDDPAEGEGGTEGGGDAADQNTDAPADKEEKKLPDDPTDVIDDDDKRAAEEAIYDSLTDEQKRIRVLQLKIDYKDLYETIINTMEGINDIPKNADNLETIKRLTTFLTKAKTILIDYVENNFDNNSYLENYTIYIKYLAIFRTTAKVVEELNKAAGVEIDKEDK